MNGIRRRDFLLASAAALSAPGLAAGGAPCQRPNLLYALSTGSWARVIPPAEPLPLLRILDETSAAGFNGVRLTGYPQILEQNGLDDDRYLAALAGRGLLFSTVSFGGDYLTRAGQRDTLDRLRGVLELHRRGGAKAAVFFPPGVVPAEQQREALGASCRFFNEMGRLAVEDYGIRLGLHNHTDTLIENQKQVDFFLNETDPRFVFCAWDTAHLHVGGCEVIGTIRNSLPRIVYLDFKDATRTPASDDYLAPNGQRYDGASHEGRFFNSMLELGRGQIDFPAIVEMLKAQSYRGWLNHDLDTIRVSCSESWRISREYIESRLDSIYQ